MMYSHELLTSAVTVGVTANWRDTHTERTDEHRHMSRLGDLASSWCAALRPRPCSDGGGRAGAADLLDAVRRHGPCDISLLLLQQRFTAGGAHRCCDRGSRSVGECG